MKLSALRITFSVVFVSGRVVRNANFKVIGNPGQEILHDDETATPKLYRELVWHIPINDSDAFSEVTIEVPPHTGYPDKGNSMMVLCEVQIYSVNHSCAVANMSTGLTRSLRNETGSMDAVNGLVSSGTVLDFDCNRNYKLVGETSTTCKPDGSFSSPPPTCQVNHSCAVANMSTGLTRSLRNETGSMDAVNGLVSSGTVLDFDCNRNYKLVGETSTTCKPDGSFSSPPPTCQVTVCEADMDSYGTSWNRTAGSSRVHVQHACPPGHTGIVYRQCAEDGIWLAPVYNCAADTLINIKQMVQSESSVRPTLESLVSFTATMNGSSPTTIVGNVQTTSDILSLIVDRVDSTEPVEEGVVEDFLDVADNLMEVNTTTAWRSILTETGFGVDKVLTSIDSLVEKAVKAGNHSGKNAEFAKSNFYVTIGRSQEAVREISFPDRTSNNLPEWARRSVNSIVLPMDNHTENVSYSSIIYKDLRGMIPGLSNESESGEEELNSPVISLTLFKKDRFPLKKPVTITFQLLDRGLNTPQCSYWNQGLTGWDTDGCVLVSYDASSGVVVCKCSHLTNFAVLMSHVVATEAHMQILRVISIVGCVTSMICLVLTLGFYIHHWKRVGSDRAILLLNLCVVLFVAYLVFLAGVDRVANKDACTSVAVVLHFLYLSVFFIMLTKSVYLTKMLLLPMNRTPITKWCLLAAYGSAAIVVAVSMGITKLHGYGTDTTCWLSVQSGLLWAFVGPALFVMAANAVVAVIILKIKFSTVTIAKKTNQEKISSGLRTILVLLPIMGITWVFGVFSVNEETVVFQYLFAVCNSLQGLLIFIFHCLLDHKMKQQLEKSARKTKRKAQPHALANMKSASGINTAQEVNLSSPSTSTRDAP